MMTLHSLILVAFLQAGAEPAMMDDTRQVSALEAFQAICFDNFADPDAVLEALNDPERGLIKEEKTGMAALQPGDQWDGATYSVTFMNSDQMPGDIPSVQCSVVASLSDAGPHPDMARDVEATLGLSDGRIGRDRPRSRSRWDFNDNWRMFFSTEPEDSQVRVRYTLLLLKD